jgi:hypothetical protein
MATSHYTPALLASGNERIVYQQYVSKYAEKVICNTQYHRAGYILLTEIGGELCVVLRQNGHTFGIESTQATFNGRRDRHVFQTVQRAAITATNKHLFMDIRDVEVARAIIMHAADKDVDTPFMLFYLGPKTLKCLQSINGHNYETVKVSSLSDRSNTGLNLKNVAVTISTHLQRCAPGLKHATEGYYHSRDVEVFPVKV